MTGFRHREAGSSPGHGNRRRWSLVKRACVFAALVLSPFSGLAQRPDPAVRGLKSIPLDEWLAVGEREEIRWRVELFRPRLSFHQRMTTTVRVTILGGQLQKKSVERELFFLVKMADAAGKWLPGEGWRAFGLSERLAKNTDLEFLMQVFVQPGTYSVVVVVYDRRTGERSLARRELRVPAISNDPMSDAGRGLPVVEFVPGLEGAEASFLPMIDGKLNLPVRTKRRVEVEILANFSASEQYSGSRVIQSVNFSILLPTLKVLAGMDLANGALTITGLDLDRQRVFFQQQNVRGLDWPRLQDALATLRTQTVDVRELQTQRDRAAFFRDVVERRVTARVRSRPFAAGNGPPRPRDDDPLRVFIVLGHGISFPRGSDLKPVAPVEDCNCRIYYVQHQIAIAFRRGDRVLYEWDQLHRILKPLEPKRFEVDNAAAMRRALAAILNDLRKF